MSVVMHQETCDDSVVGGGKKRKIDTDDFVESADKEFKDPTCSRLLQPITILTSQCDEEQRIFSGPVGEWMIWGPYLSERQWGTVREDTSEDGNCWESFSHDEATFRAYSWGEDGLMGLSDNKGNLCVALALWNGKDKILKERLFGLTGPQGNHGEDVKECYFYEDGSPSHVYMKGRYIYPQEEFPYDDMLIENAKRGLDDPEYELFDTGLLGENKYWEIEVEYAKASPHDLLLRYTVHNQGPQAARIHVLPTIWYRHGHGKSNCLLVKEGPDRISCSGDYEFAVDVLPTGKYPNLLFTDNETNTERLSRNRLPTESIPVKTREQSSHSAAGSFLSQHSVHQKEYFKDAFHQYVVKGETTAVNPDNSGTKCCAVYDLEVESGQKVAVKCCLWKKKIVGTKLFSQEFDHIFDQRREETNVFYNKIIPKSLDQGHCSLARKAYAGLLWNKQFYHYNIPAWLQHHPHSTKARNRRWLHFLCRDILSMPDKWEFPWFASWDTSFQTAVLNHIDPRFAKDQLSILLSARFRRMDGRLPGCEFDFSDPNPPVQAWACLQTFRHALPPGDKDLIFLLRCYPGLVSNYKWWLNKEAHQPYRGGFLGMDNISIFDRSNPPKGVRLVQVDGIAWAAFMCINMIELALELQISKCNPSHDYSRDVCSYLDDFCDIVQALNHPALWHEEDGFYYDSIKKETCLRIRSLVGLVPIFAVLALNEQKLDSIPHVKEHLEDLLKSRAQGKGPIWKLEREETGSPIYALSVVTEVQLRKILCYLLDEEEFLSPFGIRSLSKVHESSPFCLEINDTEYSIGYCPGESTSGIFGGNSNWRGPIWLPMNYLLIEALLEFHKCLGQEFKVMFPTGSDDTLSLEDVALSIARRNLNIFLPAPNGKHHSHGDCRIYTDDKWQDLVLFHEYFHAETGRGCGASHQTGWSALVVNLMRLLARSHDIKAGSSSTV